MNQFMKYAKTYSCTLPQAIADRDWPMNRTQCIQAFVEALDRQPTEDEIIEMRPDRERAMRKESELQDWEDFDMGRR
ncbi:MAG TPA: hypothetical protein DDY18_08995 [Flavobacterium sp.]|jgi:hypothetical protein|nr:hypothetical protein [Flavobacterium sp.]